MIEQLLSAASARLPLACALAGSRAVVRTYALTVGSRHSRLRPPLDEAVHSRSVRLAAAGRLIPTRSHKSRLGGRRSAATAYLHNWN